MPPSHRPLLRSLYSSRRHALFLNHVRIGPSIFARPCSCTASLADEVKADKLLNPTTNDPPRPPADHRQLAVAQGIFTTSPYSPGSPLLLPNGSDMFLKLANCLRSLYPRYGFREVITPTIYKKSLWEKSGHWENYAEDMFEVKGRGASGAKVDAEIGEDETYGLKPMNCPGHCLLFKAEKRSYRNLPIRYADFSALHRNEISGALSGLTRVRRFHQDDGHIFCRPSQIEQEIKATMGFIQLVYGQIFNLGPYRLLLSTRPKENYIGTMEEWDNAESQLKSALEASGREWSINEGDGAFYGPKIDVILKDSDGKEHQTATIQLDFQLPKRFELSYIAPAPDAESKGETTADKDQLAATGPVTPVMIHRAVLGSLERFMALLIEHYNGTYPLWISPRPITILTTEDTPEINNYAEQVAETLRQPPWDHRLETASEHRSRDPLPVPDPRQTLLHADIDNTPRRSLGKKLTIAREKGYNYIIVVGKKDVLNGTVSLEMSNQHVAEGDALAPGGSFLEQLPQALRGRKDGRFMGTLDFAEAQRFFARQVGQYL